MNHIMASGQGAKSNHMGSCVMIRVCSEKEPLIRRTESKIIAIVTSYEIVCATCLALVWCHVCSRGSNSGPDA